MGIRKNLYFGYHRIMGSSYPQRYEDLVKEDQAGFSPATTRTLLTQLFTHCQQHVPYYTEIIKQARGNFAEDPETFLLNFPILTKTGLRKHFEQLKSSDLETRKWHFNASGGSTGEPVKMIQDRDYEEHAMALQQFYSLWTGENIGDTEVCIWGSERDILRENSAERAKIAVANKLIRRICLNAYRMTPEQKHRLITILNTKRPKLIISYTEQIYEMACMAERENIPIQPQAAIITTASPLFPSRREKIEKVFQCKVFDRYGSREVGDIAGECSAHKGLHVLPRGSYVEILDDAGNPQPAGVEGNIVVTCLGNYAMPLIRYQIGDRGILSTETTCACGRQGQKLEKVIGRDSDVFRLKDGTLLSAGYFITLIDTRPWVERFQIIQQSYSSMLYRVKKSGYDYQPEELDDIRHKTQLVVGKDCQVDFEFIDDLPDSVSGKLRHLISKVSA